MRFFAGHRFVGVIALVATATACGDDSEPVGGGGSTATSGGSGQGGVPTEGGNGATGGDGAQGGEGGTGGEGGSFVPVCIDPPDGAIFAVSELFLGDTDVDGVESATAWQGFGRDVDGVQTTDDFSAHCTPNSGAAPANVFPDGPNGLDNSFGKSIIPIIKAAAGSGVSAPATMAIQMGGSTMVFDLVAFDGNDTDPIPTRLYGSNQLQDPPAFDGNDCWPVTANSLTDETDITSAKTLFADASITGNAWSSGTPTTIDVTFSAQGVSFPLRIYAAEVEMRLDDTQTSITQGQISGVIDTEEFAATVADIAGAFDPSLCNGAVIEGVLNQMRQASDIMADGTQDPASTCNGISIGIGFKASAGKLGGIGPAIPPPDECR